MSFFFKSSKKAGPGPNGLPPATRDIRSSDGPASQIPNLNGVGGISSKPSSPTPSQGINASLSSIAEKDRPTFPTATPTNAGAAQRLPDDRVANLREDGGARSAGSPGPEQKTARDHSRDTSRDQVYRPPATQNRPSTDNNSPSPYPWSQRRLNFPSPQAHPFPRYGAAVNATAGKDGGIYIMGGLINGSTVKGDLWMVDASAAAVASGNSPCFPVATMSEGPGPRVGHASLLVGNAYIVFGGDTKMDEGDMLDDTLYLLNTSTKQWSRALPAGPRPPGRYGHTLNILGSKLYIFGGQVEGYFFNDLVAFDLNALQQATNRWEILIQNTIDGGPPHGQIPPARTNHTVVTWGDRLFLFGGTDGVQWFNDVWAYSPHSNSWTQLDCIGYIPSAREGHAAALVGDVMYVFGGRNEEGNDLGDLAAFRITSRRWYTFQNMGPSPSPRSGHSMTAVGKQVVVLAGEPSSAPRDPLELALAYFLDTSKIRYPVDAVARQPSMERMQGGTRRPSGDQRALPPSASQGRGPPPPREITERERSGSDANRIRSPEGSRLPRAAPGSQGPSPASQPPRGPTGQPPMSYGNQFPAARQPTRPQDRAFSPNTENERPQRFDSNIVAATETTVARNSPISREVAVPTTGSVDPEPVQYQEESRVAEPPIMQKPQTYQPSQQPQQQQQQQQQPIEPYPRSNSRSNSRTQSRSNSRAKVNRPEPERLDETPRQSLDTQEPMSRVRKISEDLDRPQDSGIGSSPAFTQQHDLLTRELEQTKKQNAWYASELALARKAGYQARATESPMLDERANDAFADDDRPLVEALLTMRTELSRVQETINEQSKRAAERIAEVEKQRDTAINEAVFAKAKLAGQGSPRTTSAANTERAGTPDRSLDISRRLASSLEAQTELGKRIHALTLEVAAEKTARELAEDTAVAAQKRVAELDTYRQQNSAEVESLRTELHEVQKSARDASASHAEILVQHRLLSVDKEELTKRLESASAGGQGNVSTLSTLREAIASSTEKADLLERKLEEEREQRSELERNLRELRSQHDERSSALETASRRLQDAEELAQKHAQEARTHRDAVLAGLGQLSENDVNGGSSAHEERISILQQQVEGANVMVRQNQAAADTASEKLRRAEERIAGLEAYQEQASREGLSIRKQLQAYMKENSGLSSEKAELEQKLERHMLETNALSVQHASLKEILGERGVNASEKRRSRALDSPITARFSTPDLQRFRDLEQQLESHNRNHEELKTQYEEVSERGEKMKREYEEKLTALDNDHQAAVKYLRGTEKMLSKMKQELQRVKNENGDLKKKIDKSKDELLTTGTSGSPSTPQPLTGNEWEGERERLQQEFAATQSRLQSSVSALEGRIATMQDQLHLSEHELQLAKTSHTSAQNDLTALQTTFSRSRHDLDRLQKENALLEERAKDAEGKVQLLLDQVETSVVNYRRQSRVSGSGAGAGGGAGAATTNGTAAQHQRHPSEPGQAKSSHSRNTSTGADSTASSTVSATTASSSTPDVDELTASASADDADAARNSLALDSLATELDALRTHWETTNKNYRLSDRSADFDRTPTTPSASASASAAANATSSLADWRRGLELDDEDEQQHLHHGAAATAAAAAAADPAPSAHDDMPTPTATRVVHNGLL